jgi:hypothetical protein
MASLARRARNALKLERIFEISRLEEEIIAAAYELATPLLRRPMPRPTTSGRQPAPTPVPKADGPRRQAGGSQA